MSQAIPVPGRDSLIGGASGRTLEEHYEVLEVLGRGSFSAVHKARHRQTNEVFACKMIDKWSIHNRQRLANEIEVLQRVSHPSVIRLHDIFETDRMLALITDIAAGGELFDKIVDKGHYSEKEASEVITRLLHAIAHLHMAGIVHRDIKPENILLAGTESDVDVKLSDFGLAKIFSGDEAGSLPDNAFGRARAFTVCGTDYYVAPEVLQQAGYTHACDMWSLGVVLYILLSGCPPFYEGGEEGISVQRKIVAGAYSFPERYWGEVSAEAKDLVSQLLQTDPNRRFNVTQTLAHPWIVKHGVNANPLPQQNAELFRNFNNKRKNSVAGSSLVGSYSVFGSLQSPAQSSFAGPSFHVPGKHKRVAGNSALGFGGGAGSYGAGSLPLGSLGHCGSVPEDSVQYDPRAAAAAQLMPPPSSFGGIPIPDRGGDARGGVPIPAGRNGHQYRGGQPATSEQHQGSLSSSPPIGLLSASPNPGGGGAGFMMEI